MKNIMYILLFFLVFIGCKKDNYPLGEVDEFVDYFSKKEPKPKSQWNELDYLCDSIREAFGVEVIYEYTPRIIAGNTFFMPPQYDKALDYTRTMLSKIWLKTLKENFPKFYKQETPLEFILAGGYIHFNDATSRGAAAGAGLNAQYYRLGMGGVNNYSKAKDWLFSHIVTLYHEHAHQLDHKYGRGILFDRISQGKYYGLAGYGSITESQAQRDGFWRGYGGYAPEEDFATGVEHMVRHPMNRIHQMILTSESLELDTKYRMVHQMYLNMGVDLHALHAVVDSVVYQVDY